MSTKSKRLMTEAEFDQLCTWLDSPVGCNFRYLLDGEITWDCDGTLRMTRDWLENHTVLDVEKNVEIIQSLGGFCDCEVVFNAVGRWQET